jgi:hypothetical protein
MPEVSHRPGRRRSCRREYGTLAVRAVWAAVRVRFAGLVVGIDVVGIDVDVVADVAQHAENVVNSLPARRAAHGASKSWPETKPVTAAALGMPAAKVVRISITL